MANKRETTLEAHRDADIVTQRPFFSDGKLVDAERDEAILSGKLPPGTSELSLASEYSLAAWIRLSAY